MSTMGTESGTTRALILDQRHRCLLIRRKDEEPSAWDIPAVRGPLSSRPLEALKAFVHQALGLRLRSPAGCRVPDSGVPHDFAFVLDGRALQVDSGLQPDSSVVDEVAWVAPAKIQQFLDPSRAASVFWPMYTEILLGGYVPPRKDFDVFYFGDSPVMAAWLAHLVIKGRKRATSGFVAACEKDGSTIPVPGLISIVTDYYGVPLCVVETVEVRHVPFGKVNEDVAMGEGEGDLSYADWREGHVAFFSREAASMGLTFDDDSMVFNEFFRVIKVLGRDD